MFPLDIPFRICFSKAICFLESSNNLTDFVARAKSFTDVREALSLWNYNNIQYLRY